MDCYKSKDIKRVLGIPLSTLDVWVTKGVVTPAISEGKGFSRRNGKDGQRLFTFYNLIELKAIQALRKAGVSFQKLEKIKDYDLTQWPLLATDGVDVYATDEEGLVSLLERKGQGVLFSIVELWKIRQALEVETSDEQQPLFEEGVIKVS